MYAPEVIVENYIQALPKATRLLDDPHHPDPVLKVVTSGFCHDDYLRLLHSRCAIVCEPKTVPCAVENRKRLHPYLAF